MYETEGFVGVYREALRGAVSASITAKRPDPFSNSLEAAWMPRFYVNSTVQDHDNVEIRRDWIMKVSR